MRGFLVEDFIMTIKPPISGKNSELISSNHCYWAVFLP